MKKPIILMLLIIGVICLIFGIMEFIKLQSMETDSFGELAVWMGGMMFTIIGLLLFSIGGWMLKRSTRKSNK